MTTTCDLRPLEMNLMGGPLSLCREAKNLIIFPYVFEMKSPLGTQKFNLIQRRLDAKFDNSKLGIVRCKISPKFVSYRAIYIQWIDWFSISISIAVLQIHALYSLLAVLVLFVASVIRFIVIMTIIKAQSGFYLSEKEFFFHLNIINNICSKS